jgi:hypothetical protein
MFFYSDTGSGGAVNLSMLSRMDPTKQYCKHLDNWFFLKFVLMNSNDFNEKAQANKELTICERKLAYWKRNGNFDSVVAQRYTDDLKKNWTALS